MKRDYQKEFEEVNKEVVQPIFKRLAFKKRSNSYNRRAGEIVQVFNVQRSRWNTAESVSFTFNIGFHNDTIFKSMSEKETVPPFLNEYDCFVSMRLGHLSHNKDHWYEINHKNDIAEIKQSVYYDITRHAEPLFEKFISLEAFKEVLKEKEPYRYVKSTYALIIYFMEIGDKEKRLELLKKNYQASLIPKSSTSKIVYPDSREEVKVSKPEVNQWVIDRYKRMATYYGVEL